MGGFGLSVAAGFAFFGFITEDPVADREWIVIGVQDVGGGDVKRIWPGSTWSLPSRCGGLIWGHRFFGATPDQSSVSV